MCSFCSENRWFTPWTGGLVWFQLPPLITEIVGQKQTPFGDSAIIEIKLGSSLVDQLATSQSPTLRIGHEICEELWRPDASNIRLFGERACHLVVNVSGSYWELRKLDSAYTHARSASAKSGGMYAYVNSIGCDGGGRLVYYGRSFAMLNGETVAMSNLDEETLFDEFDVCVTKLDVSEVDQYRSQFHLVANRENVQNQSAVLTLDGSSPTQEVYKNASPDLRQVNTISLDNFNFVPTNTHYRSSQSPESISATINLSPEQEIQRYCSLWLWDYLRRTLPGGIQGLIVPLSGGLDSCSVVCLVHSLCKLLFDQIKKRKNHFVVAQLRPLLSASVCENMSSAEDLTRSLLRCVYLRTKYSGQATLSRAERLAQAVGAQFVTYDFTSLYEKIVNEVPFRVGTGTEVTLQQQNVQVSGSNLKSVFFSSIIKFRLDFAWCSPTT